MAKSAESLPIHILSSTIKIPYSGILTLHTLLEHASQETVDLAGMRIVFSVQTDSRVTRPETFLIWITSIPESALFNFEDVATRCTQFCSAYDRNSPFDLVIACPRLGTVPIKATGSTTTSSLIVLSKSGSRILDSVSLPLADQLSLKFQAEQEKSFSYFPSWAPQVFKASSKQYPTRLSQNALFNSRNWKSQIPLVVRGCALLLFCFLVLSIIIPRSNLGYSEYIRYPTPNSEGPKHQLRIYLENATEWSRNNPHDNGEWRIRLDDQALIPAHLYDEEEDRYQQWFRARYPHFVDIVEKKNHIRPSWLGSWNVAVLWDHQFHDAHCAIAFRRYFKAKETGKHVCGRDIDHFHIKHCLDRMDEKAFPEGPMVIEDPPTWMYWQTKVCF